MCVCVCFFGGEGNLLLHGQAHIVLLVKRVKRICSSSKEFFYQAFIETFHDENVLYSIRFLPIGFYSKSKSKSKSKAKSKSSLRYNIEIL